MKRFVPVLLLLLSACSPVYVLRAGWEEAKILSRRKPIAKLVADSTTPPAVRGKLATAQEARLFARDSLRLDVGKSYTTFSQLDSDTLALVLSAARKDRFEAHTWWFPIVGHVPYKGFFSEEKARKEMAKLEAKGFDTYLRPTSAFSTLGWFSDPLVSPLLRYDSVGLANTVIHELFHNTLYVPGQAMFNESLANFVGSRGAIDFFCHREGSQSAHCREAEAEWRDEMRFGEFLSALVADLERLYAREDLTSEEKIAEREEIFRRSRSEFSEKVQPELEISTYANFANAPLNNATLIARRLYYYRLGLFEQVYQESGRDLPETIRRIVAAAKGSKDPYGAVEALVADSG